MLGFGARGWCLTSSKQPPEAVRDATIAHIGALTACSKGLTRSNDIFTFALEDPDTPEGQALLLAIEQARSDSRMVMLREEIVRLIGTIMARWCVDAEVSTVSGKFDIRISSTYLNILYSPHRLLAN